LWRSVGWRATNADSMGFDFILVIAGGLLAGGVGDLMGLGGGIVAVPFLNLVVGVPVHVAAAAGLISTLSVSCGAAGRYLRRGGLIDVPLALRLELFAAAGGLVGGVVVGWIEGPALQVLFAATLLYGAFHIHRSSRRTAGTGPPGTEVVRGDVSSARRAGAFGLCFAAGVMSGLLGIGGGIVIVPVIHLVLALPFKNATATSNFMMGLTAVPALCGFVARGQLDLGLAAPLAVGVLLGANLGAHLMPRIATRWLKLVFACLLVVTAVEMARKGVAAW